VTRQAARPVLLKVGEAAQALGLNESQVYAYIRNGTLGCYQYPGRTGAEKGPVRVPQSEVDRFLAAHYQPAGT
jgi:excisionase family DNA binding protein